MPDAYVETPGSPIKYEKHSPDERIHANPSTEYATALEVRA